MIMRGDLFSACLDPVVGSEQGGIRPVLVVQNDVGNKFSPTIIVVPLTSQREKPSLPTHILVSAGVDGLQKDSLLLAEQVRTIDKSRLLTRMGRLGEETMRQVDAALRASMHL